MGREAHGGAADHLLTSLWQKDLDLEGARARVARLAWLTPVLPLADRDGPGGVHLKLESLQRTGSFKLRGATNRLLTLPEAAAERGVVTCSSGNHGRAVAEAGRQLGIPTTVCVPRWTDPVKARAIEGAGAHLVWAGETYDEAEERAAAVSYTHLTLPTKA